MRLSVCTLTKNSGATIEYWMARALEFADEIVVSVDAGSSDATEELARRYADCVRVVEVIPGQHDVLTEWTMQQATGDWILFLDDDQLMSRKFAEQVPRLMEDRRFTHYHLPQRWVVGSAREGYHWIRQFPWYPDYQVRMVRNLGGIFGRPARQHSEFWAHGEGAKVDPDGPIQLYHFDLAWRSRAEREEKVRRYRENANGGVTCEEYYLYEDYLSTLDVVPVPSGELEGEPSLEAASQARARALRPVGAGVSQTITISDLADYAASLSDDPPMWGAEYVHHGTPPQLLTNRGYIVPVTVRNTSRAAWPNLGTITGRVVLCYRWFHELFGNVIEAGDRTILPASLQPGEQVSLLAGLWTPQQPGHYRLDWEMLCERVSWFSDRGVPPLSVDVDVVDEGPRPQAPRFARTQGVSPGLELPSNHAAVDVEEVEQASSGDAEELFALRDSVRNMREHTDLGLPLPHTRFRFVKQAVVRICWVFLHRQVAFNRAVADVVERMTEERFSGSPGEAATEPDAQ